MSNAKLGADGYHVPVMYDPMIGPDGELIEKYFLMTAEEYATFAIENEEAAAEIEAENAWLRAAESPNMNEPWPGDPDY